jgi:hypothetical protein
MKNRFRIAGLLPLMVLVLLGCYDNDSKGGDKPATPAAPAKKASVGKNIYLEVQGDTRRVVIDAYVCLRMGQLEQLLTKKRTKEHEAILAADINAADLHKALILARAEPGSPVEFRPKWKAPRGTAVKITLEYEEKGKTVRTPAQQWIRNGKTKKELEYDWVFAGSILIPDPMDATKPPFYGANDGDVICLANFDTALLDIPVASPRDNAELYFEAITERIPPQETKVRVILEPVLEKANEKKDGK